MSQTCQASASEKTLLPTFEIVWPSQSTGKGRLANARAKVRCCANRTEPQQKDEILHSEKENSITPSQPPKHTKEAPAAPAEEPPHCLQDRTVFPAGLPGGQPSVIKQAGRRSRPHIALTAELSQLQSYPNKLNGFCSKRLT